jgi:hypothetical protein
MKNVLPDIYQKFKTAFEETIISNIPNEHVKENILLFKNIFDYLFNKVLTKSLYNNKPSAINNKNIDELIFALLDWDNNNNNNNNDDNDNNNDDIQKEFDDNEESTQSKRILLSNEPIINAVDTLIKLTEGNNDILSDTSCINELHEINHFLSQKIELVEYIIKLVSIVIVEHTGEFKKIVHYVSADKTKADKNGYAKFELISAVSIEKLFSMRHSVSRDDKYKPKLKNLEDVTTYYNTLIYISNKLKLLKNIIDFQTTYKITLLRDCMYDMENHAEISECYNKIFSLYELFADNKIYDNLYKPLVTYIYLNPALKKLLKTDHKTKENLEDDCAMYYVYGLKSLYDTNKQYIKNFNKSSVKNSINWSPFILALETLDMANALQLDEQSQVQVPMYFLYE